ncbi:MAG: WecB/TagA/CpsF family glycosyltransferase [Clostridia bacterium]|nr:WecB/TagA/CpsF family glycosyltransferase [Clostridia bacterium]
MKVDVLGLKIDDITMDAAVEKVLSFVKSEGSHSVYTPNAEMSMAAVNDPAYLSILNSSDLLIPDGAGVVLGAKLIGTPIKEKVAGIELVLNLLASRTEFSVFLYGGKPGTGDMAAENIKKKYPNVTVCGVIHGYHKPGEKENHIDIINEASPDLILVGLSFPAQEKWINSILPKLQKGTAIGCGGTIDYLAGEVKRSPEFMIKLNLEWLDRLIRQPKRLGRMMKIPVFLFLCLKSRLKK